MKNVQKELLFISKTISKLSAKVEKLAQELMGGDAGKASAKKAKAPRRNKKTKVKQAVRKSPAKKATPRKRTVSKGAASGAGILDTVYGMISRSRNGVSVAQLREKTDFEVRQVNNAIYKLKQKGKIEALSRGVYGKKKG
jgi:hypothetical protein